MERQSAARAYTGLGPGLFLEDSKMTFAEARTRMAEDVFKEDSGYLDNVACFLMDNFPGGQGCQEAAGTRVRFPVE